MKTLRAHSYWYMFLFVAAFLSSGCGEYGEYVDNVTSHELAGILRQGGFPADQVCNVEHSYYSATPPPNNDYFRAYAIHLAPFPETLLTTNQDGLARWQAGADTNDLHLRVLHAAQAETSSTTNVWWLPPLEEFSGTNYYRLFVHVGLQGGEPNPAAFYAYNRQKETLYVIGYKH